MEELLLGQELADERDDRLALSQKKRAGSVGQIEVEGHAIEIAEPKRKKVQVNQDTEDQEM
jgi:hypothetical protein